MATAKFRGWSPLQNGHSSSSPRSDNVQQFASSPEIEYRPPYTLYGTTSTSDMAVEPGALRQDKEGESSVADHVSPLTRKPTYKEQKRKYKVEKKRLTDEIVQCLAESTFLIESGWLKARTTIKTWTKVWCDLKPGGMILYRNEARPGEANVWIGTILLNVCRVIMRPSKKEGFCFKIYHPLEQSIWANKGPHGEILKGLYETIVPLPENHVILRAANDARGREWLSCIELVVKHSPDFFTQPANSRALIRKSTSSDDNGKPLLKRMQSEPVGRRNDDTLPTESPRNSVFVEDSHWNESDSPEEDENEFCSEKEDGERLVVPVTEEEIKETLYTVHKEEELGQHNKGLEERIPEEEKSLFWHLLSQVRPGMDLSKVTLPTFILDPRSLLDKLSDYYYHADLIARASQCEQPFDRMKGLVVWYLSGFYKKPKGVKKPYNPILGEVFRCVWEHPGETPSRTFYVAEQVSHHPPVTAFYVSNRNQGFTISGGILTRSKYKGNSILAILEGTGRLKLLNRGEEYFITMPHVICKGMLFGKLSMDMGGKVTISCPTTGYTCELNFSVWLTRTVNPLEGKIKLGDEVMATLQGSWDGEIYLTDAKTKHTELCWKPIPNARLPRYTVPVDSQEDFESEKLWSGVTAALSEENQVDATREKTLLEDNQREAARQRAQKNETWTPRLFTQDAAGEWIYKHADTRPWDPQLDLHQYEKDFVIQTKLRHQGPSLVQVPCPVVDTGFKSSEKGSSFESTGKTVQRRKKSRQYNEVVDSDTSDEISRQRIIGLFFVLLVCGNRM
ncbi:hypothetical protein RvY_09304-2 [Ramazzottius varieornatus]|uniref:Oxysterol-binding protein n=1 Tax=Ramazzottius varieornatus TaxID=947166 RepID=A0A1D1V8U7_RAMVA|nr:hypothetical protein RvY_09304-2 [Ramazzottius varieornatus]